MMVKAEIYESIIMLSELKDDWYNSSHIFEGRRERHDIQDSY